MSFYRFNKNRNADVIGFIKSTTFYIITFRTQLELVLKDVAILFKGGEINANLDVFSVLNLKINSKVKQKVKIVLVFEKKVLPLWLKDVI